MLDLTLDLMSDLTLIGCFDAESDDAGQRSHGDRVPQGQGRAEDRDGPAAGHEAGPRAQ